jgi:hypothetical protein
MAANITEIMTNVRKDLHDEDAAAYRWTDSSLTRHITRAVHDYTIAEPLEQKSVLVATPGSRDISVASLASLLSVEAVEWPTGNFPPERVAWSQWQTTLTLDVVAAPSAADNVNIYWLKSHTLDATSSTIPPQHDELIAEGAAGYAALDWTSFATNRLNIGSADVWGRYKAFADERLKQFRQDLVRLGRDNAVRQRQLYTSADPPSVFEQARVKY